MSVVIWCVRVRYASPLSRYSTSPMRGVMLMPRSVEATSSRVSFIAEISSDMDPVVSRTKAMSRWGGE